jgi:uncharacterized protein YbaR (Trm112 family)
LVNRTALQILRCPFCGGSFELADSKGARADEHRITHGTLFCSCASFPIGDRIPVLIAGSGGEAANETLAAGHVDQARDMLLGIAEDASRQQAFRRLLRDAPRMTFRDTLAVLGSGQEADYFLYRFSDPRFVTSEGMLRAIAAGGRLPEGRAIDLCGGTGHLARSLRATGVFEETWLTDLQYWKIWLAKRFIAPACNVVVCDSDRALPFMRDSFSLAFCSGAFEYVWSRRSFGEEMQRLVGQTGLVLLTHLKNQLCRTFNPGMPLSPDGYRGIFAHWPTKLYGESEMFESVLAGKPVDLSTGKSDEKLESEPGLILASTQNTMLFAAYPLPPLQLDGRLCVNPLYRPAAGANGHSLQLSFPSSEYEDEFGDCRRYLTDFFKRGEIPDADAAARRMLLQLPENYL